ncbi:hypothetical protein SH580_06555 [Coraliomargarita algicola]|uniref:Glycosyl transferase family 1 domain-containing protein n=1 Tax=Coraliomargarita algicola TaxID=3092156 RepID=A0ABZ0RPP1_9BACT|nr:glycosyltransferase [Coraliomargarita sp. J2-16]WPJ97368.1 hypothetical protein SH580_06555 [Coraliomargarita sp. J2-16]
MKTVILADTGHSGHRRVWLAAFAETFLAQGHHVILVLPDPQPVLELIQSRINDTSTVSHQSWDLPRVTKRNRAFFKNLGSSIRIWRSLSSTIKALPQKPDLVLLPFLDVFVCHGIFPQFLDRVFPFVWYGIYFQPQWTRRHTEKHMNRSAYFLETIAVRSKYCRGLGILDEGVGDIVASKHKVPVHCFPDFIYPSIEAHESELGKSVRNKANNRKIVSFVGTIQSRKGFESFLQLMDVADPLKYYFLIAGKFTPNCFPTTVIERWESLKKEPPENVTVFNGAIENDQDYYDLFRQSDVIWGAYEDWPHSSNVLTLSAAFKTPILVSDHYLMAERVRQFKLGAVLPDERSGAALLKAVEQLTVNTNGAYDDFTKLHSLDALSTQLVHILALNQAT